MATSVFVLCVFEIAFGSSSLFRGSLKTLLTSFSKFGLTRKPAISRLYDRVMGYGGSNGVVVRDFERKFEIKDFNRFPVDRFIGVYTSVVRVSADHDVFVSMEVTFHPKHSSVKFKLTDRNGEIDFPERLDDLVKLSDFQTLPKFGSDLFGATLKMGDRRKVAIFSKKDFFKGSDEKQIYPTFSHVGVHTLLDESEHFVSGRYRAVIEGPNPGMFLDVTFEFFDHTPDLMFFRAFFIDRSKNKGILDETDLAAISFENLKMDSSGSCVIADVFFGERGSFVKFEKLSSDEGSDYQPGYEDTRFEMSVNPFGLVLEVPPVSELPKPEPGLYGTVDQFEGEAAFGLALTLHPDSETMLRLRYSADLDKKDAIDANLLFTVEGGWMVVRDDMSKRLMPEKMISFKSLTFGKDWISGVFKINGKNRLLMLTKVNE